MASSSATGRRTKGGGQYCVAGGPNGVGCKNGQFTEGISIHIFPQVKGDGSEADKKREKARRLWLQFVKKHRSDFVVSKTSILCSAHFEPSCFDKHREIAESLGIKRRLLLGAYPTTDTAGLPTPTIPATNRARRRVLHEAIASVDTESVQLQGDGKQDGQTERDGERRDAGELEPPIRICEDCPALKKRVQKLQKTVSRLRARERQRNQDKQADTIDSEIEDVSKDTEVEDHSEDTDQPLPEPSSPCDEEEEEEEVLESDDDDEEYEVETDYEPEESSAAESVSSDRGEGDDAEGDDAEGDDGRSRSNRVNVEPGTHWFGEPKFMVFFSMLVSLFSLFCFKCKRDNPKVKVTKNGTMATVIQDCKSCGKNSFTWKSQPLVFGKYAAGNILMSFGILASGVSIAKTFLLFKHIGMSMFTPRTFFYRQAKFLVPAILRHWEAYRQGLISLLKGKGDLTWSGDGRYDSMGHSAKYGTYTMFCNSISKLVHFEMLQSNQSGNSNKMELHGAKLCFKFLSDAGLKVSTFITDRHRGICAWIRDEQKDTAHFFDLWHLCKSLVKELSKASKEKGCEVIKHWIRSIKKHMYWCALSTTQGFGDLIVAKWKSIVRHVANKHDSHPDESFPKCAHGRIEHDRKWIFSGSLAHDKLCAVLLKKDRLKDVRKLPSDAQTSCLEGFHSTLNHWHPKMTHFSWLGSYCRHILAVLHFNENLKRQMQTTKEGRAYYRVTYPKYKLGEEVVKRQAVPPTYKYVRNIRDVMCNTSQEQLKETRDKYEKKVPKPLCSQFPDRRSRQEAIVRYEERRQTTTQLYPTEEEQSRMKVQLAAEASISSTRANLRKPRTCKKCKQPMKGHPKSACPSTSTPGNV